MEQNSWTITFEALDGPTPAPQRVRRLLKIAKDWGLIAKAARPLGLAVFEWCCKVMCQDCAAGEKVGRDALGQWWHRRMSSQCGAHALREAKHVREKGAKDASTPNASGSLPQVPRAAERDGRSGSGPQQSRH